MGIETVTITGADDYINPYQLAAWSQDFPFAEWGILIGSSDGMSRFPSIEWIKKLIGVREKCDNKINLSLHICGKYLREIAQGKSSLADVFGGAIAAFDRCQLNWHAERQGPIGEKVFESFCNLMIWDPVIIFQIDGVNDDLRHPSSRKFRCAGLFDRSHGMGILPGEWPEPLLDMQSGYAGGLGPENLYKEIPRILEVSGSRPIWIDMETNVRTAGHIDFGKVRKCLEISAGHVAAKSR